MARLTLFTLFSLLFVLSAFAMPAPLPEDTNLSERSSKKASTKPTKLTPPIPARATYYYQEGAVGACGIPHSDKDIILAIAPKFWNGGKYCFEEIEICGDYDGKKVCLSVPIVDLCEGCDLVVEGREHFDLSYAAFGKITHGGWALGVATNVTAQLPFPKD